MNELDAVRAYREYRDHALCSHSYASPRAFAEHADAAIEALEADRDGWHSKMLKQAEAEARKWKALARGGLPHRGA